VRREAVAATGMTDKWRVAPAGMSARAAASATADGSVADDCCACGDGAPSIAAASGVTTCCCTHRWTARAPPEEDAVFANHAGTASPHVRDTCWDGDGNVSETVTHQTQHKRGVRRTTDTDVCTLHVHTLISDTKPTWRRVKKSRCSSLRKEWAATSSSVCLTTTIAGHRTHTHTHTRTHAHTHTRTQAHASTYKHTQAHTSTHKHTRSRRTRSWVGTRRFGRCGTATRVESGLAQLPVCETTQPPAVPHARHCSTQVGCMQSSGATQPLARHVARGSRS